MKLFRSIEEQITSLKAGTSEVILVRAAALNDGILKLQNSEKTRFIELFKSYKGTCAKFVPASGAASRMFSVLIDLEKLDTKEKLFFINNITKLPFYEQLEDTCFSIYGEPLKTILGNGELTKISSLILSEKGLNFGSLPKGLIPVNKYAYEAKTCFQEQVTEANALFLGNEGCKLHFTVSESYELEVLDHISPQLENHTSSEVSFSVQMPETNTISLKGDGGIFSDEEGQPITRPGGHGALIHNLNQLDEDVIFIKNIDNVSRIESLEEQIAWKHALGGFLLELQSELHTFQRAFHSGDLVEHEVIAFYKTKFYKDIKPSDISHLIFRPIRVCGMVKNQGQPGGGPYFIQKNNDVSLQIVESAEINKAAQNQLKKLTSSTHFNPVDIVCGVKDYKGDKYNLLDFIDKSAFFVTQKPLGKEDLTVLELPGLWNGAMSDWNTVFMEVPSHTFNPIKTVIDLIRNVD